jgi:hypothetical protein
MVIDQRYAGSGNTLVTGAETFVVDRFVGYKDGGVITSGQSSVAPAGFTNSISWSVGTGYSATSGQYTFLKQHIEGFNTADLGLGTSDAKTITLSFWVRASVTGTYSGTFTNGAISRCYAWTYTINSANTWEYKTITVPGDTSGTWVGATNGIGLRIYWDLGSGTGPRTTAGTWQTGTYIGVTGTTSISATTGATFYITGVQLEKGTQATAFDYRDYGNELRLCQRYYYQRNIVATSSDYISVLQCFNTGGVYGKLFDLPVTMRATPTGSMSSITHFRGSTSGGNGTTSFSAGSIDVLSPTAVGTQGWSGISGLTGGNATVITASTVPSWIAVSAEL